MGSWLSVSFSKAFDVSSNSRFTPGDPTDLSCCWGLRESCVLSVDDEDFVGFREREGLEHCEMLVNCDNALQ